MLEKLWGGYDEKVSSDTSCFTSYCWVQSKGNKTTFLNTPPPINITDNEIIVPSPSTSEAIEIVMVTDNVTTGLDISEYILKWNDYLKENFDIDSTRPLNTLHYSQSLEYRQV